MPLPTLLLSATVTYSKL